MSARGRFQRESSSVHSQGNNYTCEHQAQEGNQNGYNFRSFIDWSKVTIADRSCRDERPVKAIKARPTLFFSYRVPQHGYYKAKGYQQRKGLPYCNPELLQEFDCYTRQDQ